MMVENIIVTLRNLGIELWVDDEQLRFRAPPGVFTDVLKQQVRTQKTAIIELLKAEIDNSIVVDSNALFEPFPLTPIQEAYLLGRSRGMPYGGLPCQAYLEVEISHLLCDKFEQSLNETIKQYSVLRTRISEDGYQQVLTEFDYQTVQITPDVPTNISEDTLTQHCLKIREQMLTASLKRQISCWPLYQVVLTPRTDKSAIIHLLIDLMVMDFVSVNMLLECLIARTNGDINSLPISDVNFRDIVIHQQRLKTFPNYYQARQYWRNRINDLGSAPNLPMNKSADPYAITNINSFKRMFSKLSQNVLQGLREQAQQQGLTLTALLLTVFIEVIRRWSKNADFVLNLTMMNRPILHEDVQRVLGDFTEIILFQCSYSANLSFAQRAQNIQTQLWKEMQYSIYSGVEVLREIAKEKGREAAFLPIIFTSTVGATEENRSIELRLRDGITWTPQVWLDCQLLEADGQIYMNWDYRADVIERRALEDMFAAYKQILDDIATQDFDWQRVNSVVRDSRSIATNIPTSSPYQGYLLHQPWLQSLHRFKQRTAIVDSRRQLTYQQLYNEVCHLAHKIDQYAAGQVVAIVMDKGVEQVISVLAILISGRAYVPIDASQPQARRELILEDADVDLILTQPQLAIQMTYKEGKVIVVEPYLSEGQPYDVKDITPKSLAYIIYTSGTTGQPKGVAMSHEAAMNTILDINHRVSLSEKDVVFGLANLSFDLSVYDIFGPLSFGAKLVLPDPALRSSPRHWCELLVQHQMTLWNSVPAQAVMLYDYLIVTSDISIDSLRIMLLSGDWISVTLADNFHKIIPDLDIVSLGGATEAAIWSIWHQIEAQDNQLGRIPYGRALTGQQVQVLDHQFELCPIGVVGDIYISGLGLAIGYFNDEEKTKESFIYHPQSGQRIYKTGDLGLYLDNGEIEFLGRDDQQVKIRGHRIELGEISSVLEKHSDIVSAVVIHEKQENFEQLVAFVVPNMLSKYLLQKRKKWLNNLSHQLNVVQKSSASFNQEALIMMTSCLRQIMTLHIVRLLQELNLPQQWSIECLIDNLCLPMQYERLVKRWIILLTQKGYVSQPQHHLYSINIVDNDGLDEKWWKIYELGSQCNYPFALLDYFRSSANQLLNQLQGKIHPTHLFFPKGSKHIAKATFRDNPSASLCNMISAKAVQLFIEQHAESKSSTCTILEVGAGIGGLTESIIEVVLDQNVHYIMTDISAYYLNDLAEQYCQRDNITIKYFDLLKEPTMQGIPADSVDIVICGDVLHALPDIPKALETLSKVLKAGGWLVMLEATDEHPEALASLELMLGNKDHSKVLMDFRAPSGRVFLTASEWQQLLETMGWVVITPLPSGTLANIGLQTFIAQYQLEKKSVEKDDLFQYLSERLPNYMLPNRIELLEQLPLSDNGKVNHKQLYSFITPYEENLHPSSYVQSLTNEVEERMAALWTSVLNTEVTDRNTGFFNYGGDSLLAARLAAKIIEQQQYEQHHFDDVLRLLMEGGTIAHITQVLQQHSIVLADNNNQDALILYDEEVIQNVSRLSIRAGYPGSKVAYIIINFQQDTGFELISQELSVLGMVIEIGCNPALCESIEQDKLFEEWLQSTLSQLPDIRQMHVNLIAKDDDALVALSLGRRLNSDHFAQYLQCWLLHPDLDRNNPYVQASEDTIKYFVTFDITIVADSDPSLLSQVNELSQYCLGNWEQRIISKDELIEKIFDLFECQLEVNK
ncbi:non-ribosomal peptide synthetase [Photorhabdus aegyptia]|uniref:Methyltransferase enzyme/thioester reductase family protein n=1 Tax=Photorhabdus aegyptia TaxID=2805098 RepID=A0A022PLP0_9GAMM|nr:non-ribosomal peptide synthetase [Photorhabdus aegyptia]EYU16536.1 Methyltransferase enzyme/thioester reductase family protein [Photorhabdus aegyptia]